MFARFAVVFSLMLLASNFAFAQAPKEVNLLWLNLSKPLSKDLVVQELERPYSIPGLPAAQVRVTDLTQIQHYDPFLLMPSDFYVGNYLPLLSKRAEEEREGLVKPPEIKKSDAFWFKALVDTHRLPDVFVFAGHGVISEGFHNNDETAFLFLPTLQSTIKTYPEAKQVFDNIKLAILWGCNTMTNLEPHKKDGSFMSPQEIYALYHSGPEGKHQVIGDENTVNTLEFYRARLAREYGPHAPAPNKWEYTRGPKFEKCQNNETKFNCEIADVDRLMPDEGLWDGTHRYNYPYMMTQIFPNATLVLGFSSASPNEEVRVKILDATLKKSYAEINAQLVAKGKQRMNNILLPLIDKDVSAKTKYEIVKVIHKNWTIETDAMNRKRPSGSISPVFPELTTYGILGAPLSRGSKQYGAYDNKDNDPENFSSAARPK